MKLAAAFALSASLAASLSHAQDAPSGNSLTRFFGGITGALSSAFDRKASQLREYISKGEFFAAEAFYRGNEEYFSEPKYEPLLREIAHGITEKHRPEMEALLVEIRAVPRPMGMEALEPAKETVSRAERLVWNIKQTPIASGRFGSPHVTELETAAGELRARLVYEPALAAMKALPRPLAPEHWEAARPAIRSANAALESSAAPPELKELRDHHVQALVAGAAAAFQQYDHANPQLFFEAYPLELGSDMRPALVKEHAAAWQAALPRSSIEQQERLAVAYGAFLDEAARQDFGRIYARSAMQTQGLREPLRPADLIGLIERLEKAGLPAAELRQRIRFWVFTPEPDAVGARLSLAPDHVAGEVAPDRIGAWANGLLRTGRNEVHVLIDPYRGRVRNGLAEVSSQSRQFVAGRRDEPNPAWESAQRELAAAQDQLRTAEQQERVSREQMRELSQYNMGGNSRLAAGLGAGMVAWGANSARDRVREAEQELRRTPRMVRKDVIETYHAPVARLELQRLQNVVLYVVEPAAGRFGKVAVRKDLRDTADLAVGVHPSDPGHASAQAANGAAQSRLLSMAKVELAVTRDELWQQLRAAAPDRTEPLAALSRAVSSDRAHWTEETSREAARFREQSARADAQLKQALSQNQAMFRRAAATRHAAIEPEPYTPERTTGQNLVDAMRDLNDALLDMREQQRAGGSHTPTPTRR